MLDLNAAMRRNRITTLMKYIDQRDRADDQRKQGDLWLPRNLTFEQSAGSSWCFGK
jgi:hypothetical protein